jgi:hypothetical protein
MPIPARLLALVDTFGRNLDSYLDPDYKETELRREFLDPLFAALGWDIDNTAGYAEAYKDVIHEETLKISGVAATAPDYSFRIGGTRKFFVEAKKPSVKIKEDPAPAAQLRRYSFSAKLPLGIVTDFHEFAIYDTRLRPRETDKASAGRIFYCTFDQYPEKWDEIAAIFSKDAVLRGSFDKYAATSKGKRGTSEFDDEFLADMEHWRDLLARNLALRNTLTERELNFAVQRVLDRIIFLRIAEDRGIEPYGQLFALTAGSKIYPRLGEIFERADFRYNSGLFHFATEKGRDESPDKLTLRLTLDDATLKEIIAALYWPKSPYAFAVIPADILGHVYEQFLGKVIHLTSDHRAVVDEKPEVRKAGGVYYTPTYIVRYIVEQTVGPLVAGKSPKQIEHLTILDPACGSGSFLLGAFDYLLDWHLSYYLAHDPAAWAKKKQPPIYETNPNAGYRSLPSEVERLVPKTLPSAASASSAPARNWQLTTAERKRILVAHLYGVDIDAQAVEVTKLSLLLKVLEGEARELRGRQLDFHRVLPDLGHNIKCGNSLIGSDFYAQPNLPAFDDEARLKLNAFDWPHEFQPIMDRGGFDAVIGNPPYRMLQPHNTNEAELAYFRHHFVSAEFKIELFHLFLQRGSALIRPGGQLGVIVPTTLLNNVYAEKLRRHLLSTCAVNSVSVSPHRVFKDADVHTSVIVIRNEPNTSARKANLIATTTELTQAFATSPGSFSATRQDRFDVLPGAVWNVLLSEKNAPLIEKLRTKFVSLESVAKINRGLITGDRTKFFSNKAETPKHLPILAGADVTRYSAKPPSEFVLFDRPPTAGGCWDEEVHKAPHKVLVRQIGVKPMASFIGKPIAVTGNLFTVRAESEHRELYLLGIINSRLTEFFWKIMFSDFKSSFPQVTIFSLAQVPVRMDDPKLKSDRAQHDALVSHVERMLKLHADLAAAKSPAAQTHLARDIAATDRAIDQLVYQLYGLTPEEIALVEAATAPPVAKSAATHEPSAPVVAPLPPEAYHQAEADAAHHFMAKEDPPPSS